MPVGESSSVLMKKSLKKVHAKDGFSLLTGFLIAYNYPEVSYHIGKQHFKFTVFIDLSYKIQVVESTNLIPKP